MEDGPRRNGGKGDENGDGDKEEMGEEEVGEQERNAEFEFEWIGNGFIYIIYGSYSGKKGRGCRGRVVNRVAPLAWNTYLSLL